MCARWDPLGNVTRTGYDALNRSTSLTDANNKTTRYTYDDADRLSTVVGPDAAGPQQATAYGYNANGQPITRTDPLGRRAATEYDKAGRLVVIDRSDRPMTRSSSTCPWSAPALGRRPIGTGHGHGRPQVLRSHRLDRGRRSGGRDALRDSDGAPVLVAAIAHRIERATVHNLTVNEAYYVGSGDTNVLVHNCRDLARAEELYGTLDNPSSTVAVARVVDTQTGW